MFNLFGGAHGDRGDGFSSGFGRGPPPGLLVDDDAGEASSWQPDGRGDRPAASSASSAAPPEAFSFSDAAAPAGDGMAGGFPHSKSNSPGKSHGEKKVKKHKRRTEETMDANMNGAGYPPPMHIGQSPAEFSGGMDMAGGMHASYQPPMHIGQSPAEFPGSMDMAGGMQASGYPPPMPMGQSPAEYHSGMDMAGPNDWTSAVGRSPPSEGTSSVSPGSSSTAHRRSRRHHRAAGETPPGAESVLSGGVPGGASGTEAPFSAVHSTPVPPYTPGSGQGFMSDLQWAYSNPDRGQQPGAMSTPSYDPVLSARGIATSSWSTPNSAVGTKGAPHNEVPLSWSTPQIEPQQTQIDDVLQSIWGPAMPSQPNEMHGARDQQTESTSQVAAWPEVVLAPPQPAKSQQAGGLDLEWAQPQLQTYSTNASLNSRTERANDLDLSWVKPASSGSTAKSTALDDPLIRTVFAGMQPPSSLNSQHRVLLGSASVEVGDDPRKKDRIIEQLQDEFKKLRDRQKDDLIQQLHEEMRRKEQQHKDTISKLQEDLRTKDHQNAALVEKMQGEIKLREQKNETLLETLQAAIKDREATHMAQVEQLQGEIQRLQQGQKDALVEHLQEEINKLKDEVLAPRPSGGGGELVMGTVLEPNASAEPTSLGFVLGSPQNDNGPELLPATPDWSSMPMSTPADMGGSGAPAWNSRSLSPDSVAAEGDMSPSFGKSQKKKGLKRWPSFGPEDDESFRTESSWMIDRESFAQYRKVFFEADRNCDGFVEGAEAREVLDKTSLPAEDLAMIWFLADTDQDGKLAWGEFLCAMHMANRRAREGIPIPEVLPPELAMHIGSPAPGDASNAIPTAQGNASDMGFAGAAEIKTSDSSGGGWSDGWKDTAGKAFHGAEHTAGKALHGAEHTAGKALHGVEHAAEAAAHSASSMAKGLLHGAGSVGHKMEGLFHHKKKEDPAQMPPQAGNPSSMPSPQPSQAQPPELPGDISPWAVSPEEAERYRNIFSSEADLHGTGFAGPWEAKQVLEQSNLPVADLSTIWQVSDMDMDGRLNVLEFTCAMALVARRLQGAPLPSGSPPPEMLASLTAAGLPSKSTGEAAFSEQSPPASPASQMSDRGISSVAGAWAPTPEELHRFQVVFESLCGPAVGGSGVLGAEEGRELFERSGLSLDELSHIWRISDADCDGQLSPPEFVCAMTLVARRRQGAPLPPELPPELARP